MSILVFLLVGCSNANLADEEEFTFMAKILQIDGDIVTVSPLERKDFPPLYDKIMFDVKDLDKINASVGDTVNVSYDGVIMDVDPALINARSWSVINKAEPQALNTRQPLLLLFMALANLLGGITCLPIGLLIQAGKMNSMHHKEIKAKFNVKAINKFVGWVLLVIPSIILLVACIPILLNIFPLVMLFVSWGLFIVIVGGGAIYVNTAPRFRLTE